MGLPALLAAIFILNLPFGYWRARNERFSRSWFLAVHLPVPAVVMLRFAFDFNWTVLPFTILAFTAGQYAGGLIHSAATRHIS